jgi:double-stranded uracil-DNA glycosylase
MPPRPATRVTTSTELRGLPGRDPLKRSFAPVANGDTRLIVLGSLPGEESLARGQYYANPRNQFWALMSGVAGVELVPLGYEERLQALLRAGIGLWDTVASATRNGSLDAAIRDHSANALTELAARLPKLRAFAFNGGKAAAVGRKALGDTPLRLIQLPSSSPAFTMPFVDKQAAWMQLKDLL